MKLPVALLFVFGTVVSALMPLPLGLFRTLYGLTNNKILALREADINTVKDLAEASDSRIIGIYGIGSSWLRRIKNVVGQAIWM